MADSSKNFVTDINAMTVELSQREKRIKELHKEIHKLNETIKNRDREHLDISMSLEREAKQKTDQVVELQLQVEKMEKQQKEVNTRLVVEYDFKIRELTKRHENDKEYTDNKMTTLKEEIATLEHFKLNKDKKEMEVEFWRNKYDQLKKEFEVLKYDNINENTKMFRKIKLQHEDDIDIERKKAKTDAEKNISEIEKNIRYENDKLRDNVVIQQSEVDFLKKERHQVLEANKNFKRDMMLNAVTIDEYSKRQYEQNKKIKLLKSKVQMLEKTLTQIVQDFEKEKAIVKFESENKNKEQDQEIKKLREQLKIRNKEIKNVRALSQMILDQRSDVEQFFLEALEQIKEEVRKKVSAERKQRRLPGINDHKGMDNKAFTDKVDLNDLDWEDRERVLRLLFSKMNAGVPPVNWRQTSNQSRHNSQMIPASRNAPQNNQIVEYDSNQYAYNKDLLDLETPGMIQDGEMGYEDSLKEVSEPNSTANNIKIGVEAIGGEFDYKPWDYDNE